jgi:hypothetical protein
LRTFSFFLQKFNLVKHLAFNLTDDTSAKLDGIMQRLSLNVLMNDKNFGEWKFSDNLYMFEFTHLPRHKPRPSSIKMLTKSGFKLPEEVVDLIDSYVPQKIYQTVFVDDKPKIKKAHYYCPELTSEIKQVGQTSDAGIEDVKGIIDQNKFMVRTMLIEGIFISQHEWLSIFENIYASFEVISEMDLSEDNIKDLESFRDEVCSQIEARKELMFRSKMALLGQKLDLILAAHNPSHRPSSSWFALSLNIFLNRCFFFLIQIWRFFVYCFSTIIHLCID